MKRVPTPDELWAKAKKSRRRTSTYYLELLHRHGYYAYPLYNRSPES